MSVTPDRFEVSDVIVITFKVVVPTAIEAWIADYNALMADEDDPITYEQFCDPDMVEEDCNTDGFDPSDFAFWVMEHRYDPVEAGKVVNPVDRLIVDVDYDSY